MQPVFVTGATGFLGAHLVCALLQKGYSIKALKRPQSAMNEFDFISGLYFGQERELGVKNLEWVIGDINDYDSLEDNIETGQLVYHCAALVSFSQADKALLFKTNVKGTENIVNACLEKKCGKLIYVSSTAAVGRAAPSQMSDETDEWDEKDRPSNYSISKYYAELEVWRGIEEGLNAVIVNPPLIIGPCNWQKTTGRFFINASRNFPFYTEGSNSFVYVEDVCKAMFLLAESAINSERFLVVGENMQWRDFMNTVSDAMGKKRPFIEVTPWIAGMAWRTLGVLAFLIGKRPMVTKESARSSLQKIMFSSNKLKAALNFEFTPMQEAIKKTADTFYLKS
jgi:nucleoside-diphosphate-sugar epimerase